MEGFDGYSDPCWGEWRRELVKLRHFLETSSRYDPNRPEAMRRVDEIYKKMKHASQLIDSLSD